ncbi:hypothetical protein FRC03_007819, partial [Tulasnella sp. 419]
PKASSKASQSKKNAGSITDESEDEELDDQQGTSASIENVRGRGRGKGSSGPTSVGDNPSNDISLQPDIPPPSQPRSQPKPRQRTADSMFDSHDAEDDESEDIFFRKPVAKQKSSNVQRQEMDGSDSDPHGVEDLFGPRRKEPAQKTALTRRRKDHVVEEVGSDIEEVSMPPRTRQVARAGSKKYMNRTVSNDSEIEMLEDLPKHQSKSAPKNVRKKRKMIDVEDEDMDEESGGGGWDDSSSKRARMASVGPTFSIASAPRPVEAKLGPRRRFKNSDHSEGSPYPSAPPSVASDASFPTSAGSSLGTGLRGRAKLNNLGNDSKYIAQEAKVRFRVWLATKDAFPDATTATEVATEIFLRVCDEGGVKGRKTRYKFENTETFARNVTQIVPSRLSLSAPL